MKRFLTVLIGILFIIFAAIGFRAASRLSLGIEDPGKNSENLLLEGTQRNYFLIHTTDLSITQPEIISVWALFIFYTQPPQVMFLPLYPNYDDTISKSLYSAFKLSNNGSVDSRFIQELEDRFQIDSTGYAIVDNAGLSLFQKWLINEEVQISAVNPRTAEEKHFVLYNGEQFFQSLCDQISTKGSRDYANRIKWTEVLPSHFSTDLSFEAIALAVDYFRPSGTIVQCNVLSDE